MKKLVLALFIFLPLHAKATVGCTPEFDSLIKKYTLDPDKTEIRNFEKNGQALLDEIFQERLKWHRRLALLPNACKVKLKDVFLKMREKEDYIGAHFFKAPQISAQAIDYKKIPLPIYSPGSYAPYHTADALKPFAFKTGDILITKGVSFTSSTISEVVAKRALFSHMVFVHVDDKTKEVTTMESYIGYGVKLFSIEEALRNENARILVLRSKDSDLAQKAANYMFERIKKKESEGARIPYDYVLNFDDNSKLSCEEIAFDAFKTATSGKMIIPENLSQVDLKDQEFLKQIGIKAGPLMMPVDLEIDSRFDLVLDWTDYQVIRDSARKDAVMGEIFHWMNEHQYKFHSSVRAIAAKLIWFTRPIPGLWNLMAKVSGIPADFQRDVPGVAISTLENIKQTGGTLLNFITDSDEEFHRQKNRWMTPNELRQSIDRYLLTGPRDVTKYFHR